MASGPLATAPRRLARAGTWGLAGAEPIRVVSISITNAIISNWAAQANNRNNNSILAHE